MLVFKTDSYPPKLDSINRVPTIQAIDHLYSQEKLSEQEGICGISLFCYSAASYASPAPLSRGFGRRSNRYSSLGDVFGKVRSVIYTLVCPVLYIYFSPHFCTCSFAATNPLDKVQTVSSELDRHWHPPPTEGRWRKGFGGVSPHSSLDEVPLY